MADLIYNNSISPDLCDELYPYVAYSYLVSGNTLIYKVISGDMYLQSYYAHDVGEQVTDVNRFPYGIPINEVHHYRDCEVTIKDGALVSDKRTIIANHLSDDLFILKPKPVESTPDILSDLLCSTYEAMKDQDTSQAFVCLQAFLLMHRIVTERLPLIGGTTSDIGVTPYAL